MVSVATIVAIGACVFLSLVLPLGLAVWLWASRKISIKPLMCGVTMFCISQVFIRMPVISMVQTQPWYVWMVENPWIIGFFLAFTAGLVEEWGRYFGSRTFAKGQFEFKDAIAYGIGHGGMEAIVMLGIASINNLIMVLAVNNGTLDGMVGKVGADQVAAIKDVFINTPAINFLMGGIERVMAMAIQIGLSVLVFVAIRKQKRAIVWAAVGLHTVINLPLGVLAKMGLWPAEGYIFICCLFCIWMTFALKAKYFAAQELIK